MADTIGGEPSVSAPSPPRTKFYLISFGFQEILNDWSQYALIQE